MQVLVLDLESTGFKHDRDCVVEVGAVCVDTEKKTVETAIDTLVHEAHFDPLKVDNAWIFKNSTMSIDEILRAPGAEEVYPFVEECMKWADAYTAYNHQFDFGYLGSRGVSIDESKILRDPMHVLTPILALPGPY